ncbi:MAG: DUF3179 domain-containing protein [Phycisphaerales bacterium]|nr:DUF3179 domain-containing protein [Phycisphaerales bacterium]
MSRTASTSQTRLTFAAGGWVIALAALIVAAIIVFALLGVMRGEKPIGDGRDVTTYGFDLTNFTLPRESLAASGNPRDFLRALDLPETRAGAEVAAHNANERMKYAVTTDRVIGVEVNGEVRAYPLQMMNVHEIVNDELGGVPIAVTYSPLCDSAVVFDRRVGGRTLSFGVSGLLINSNLVMYDRPIDPKDVPSLWSQLAFRAVAGPAALRGESLSIIAGVEVSTWAAWFRGYPQTTVALAADADRRRMKETDYERYWADGRVNYPVVPLQPGSDAQWSIPFAQINPASAPMIEAGMSEMTMVIAVESESGWKVLPQPILQRLVGPPEGFADSSVLGVRALWRVVPQRGATIEESDAVLTTVPCRWFAWQAFHPFHSR